MTVVLAMAAAVLLASAVLVLALYLARRRLVDTLRRALTDIAGPALIRSMSPGVVLGELLPRVYGEDTGHDDVLVGVLGGPGRDSEGRDTAVSRSTTAHFRLRAINATTYEREVSWTHRFSGVHNSHKLVIFATDDRAIWGLIPSRRVFPLFESFFFEDEDNLEDFVQTLGDTVELGVSYTDVARRLHRVEPRTLRGEGVPLRQYDQFIRLPDEIDRRRLHIEKFDLWDLADDDHVVESIESLTIRTSSCSPLDDGFIIWSPPHPSFVREITFDVGDLSHAGQKLVYRVVPFTMKVSATSIQPWAEISDRIVVRLESWMLPGHGVALLWRPVDRLEAEHASVSW